MKRIFIGLVAAASLLVLNPGIGDTTGVSDYQAGAPANGIAASRHNLGALGKVLHTNQTSEICVFCHTPHHSNTAAGSGPIWNRSNSTAATYTSYGTTLGGSSTGVGGTTLACLSCHDGVTTFDNLVNLPGKGGVSSTGVNQAWVFRMPTEGPSQASFKHDFFNTAAAWTGPGVCANCHEGIDNPAMRLSIGTVLSNDHPMSVTYTPGVASLRPTNTVINSIDLMAGLASSASSAYGGNLQQNRWAVKGAISNTATIADLLRDGKVECTSCHDPHFRNLSWDEVEPTWLSYWDEGSQSQLPFTWCSGEDCTDGNFLRRVGGNTGSGICRTCHNK